MLSFFAIAVSEKINGLFFLLTNQQLMKISLLKTPFFQALFLNSLLFPSFANAANEATGTANANVVTTISVAAGNDLEFGNFSSGGTLGTITQAGVVTGGVTSVSGGATRSAATFTVTGDGNNTYTFTLPSTVTLNSGANSMDANLSFNNGTASRTLSSGAETVTINGTLNVGANQATGSYSGTYDVSVSY